MPTHAWGLLAFLPTSGIGLPLRPACLSRASLDEIRSDAIRQRHADFGSERCDRATEVEAVTLADMADRVAMSLTAEAVIVPVFVDREGRCALGMEWTACGRAGTRG